MPKAREAIRMVERDGRYHVRTRGSHRHSRHPDKPGTVTIPGNPDDEVPRGTWLNIQRQAGLRGSAR